MDASPAVLAENVRAKRAAVDNDIELLRVRLQRADPRRIDTTRWAKTLVPVAAGAVALLWWNRRRHRVTNLEQLLVHGLTELYHAEQQLVPALERMSAAARNEDLEQALDHHRFETEAHVERLERVFRAIGARPRRGPSGAIEAIVADAEKLLGRKVNQHVRDAWIIAVAQRVEHLEIANYGTVRTYAQMLGHTYAAQLLQETLDEEKAADEKLTMLAQRFVNPESVRATRAH